MRSVATYAPQRSGRGNLSPSYRGDNVRRGLILVAQSPSIDRLGRGRVSDEPVVCLAFLVSLV